jgi:hypothetical protein
MKVGSLTQSPVQALRLVGREHDRPRISFIRTARHGVGEIERAVTELVKITPTARLQSRVIHARQD